MLVCTCLCTTPVRYFYYSHFYMLVLFYLTVTGSVTLSGVTISRVDFIPIYLH